MARKRDRIRLNKHYVIGTVGKTYILLRDIPYKTSDLINDAEFQNKDQVDQLIAAAIGEISSFTFEVVEELPEVGEEGVIYLVPALSESDLDIYNEYVWVNGQYERLGSTSIDSVQVVHFEVVSDVLTADRTYSDIVSDIAEGKAVVGIYSENNVVDSYLVLNEFDGTGYDLVFDSQAILLNNSGVNTISAIRIIMSSADVLTKTSTVIEGLPSVTSSDVGKVARVNSNGEWEVGEGLPTVTSADNGKSLGVVNGQWVVTFVNINNIEQTSGDQLIINCGTSNTDIADPYPNANGVAF